MTVPQATATAQAGLDATATATAWTPTPEPTVAASVPVTAAVGRDHHRHHGVTTTTGVTTAVTASAGVTATATTEPTPEPQPTAAILTDTLYNESLTALQNNLQQVSGLSVEDYRKIIEARLLRDKLAEIIGTENVTATTEQVHARHILLRVREPQPTATPLAPDAPTPTPCRLVRRRPPRRLRRAMMRRHWRWPRRFKHASWRVRTSPRWQPNTATI